MTFTTYMHAWLWYVFCNSYCDILIIGNMKKHDMWYKKLVIHITIIFLSIQVFVNSYIRTWIDISCDFMLFTSGSHMTLQNCRRVWWTSLILFCTMLCMIATKSHFYHDTIHTYHNMHLLAWNYHDRSIGYYEDIQWAIRLLSNVEYCSHRFNYEVKLRAIAIVTIMISISRYII